MQAPELQLSQEEAEQYAKAVASVARHYDLGASAKTLDWINLCTTMGSIYGVRAMSVVARRKRREKPEMGVNGGPAMNGHNAPPARTPPAEEGAIDWSLMTGRPGAVH